MTEVPSPGSTAAIVLGCVCSPEKNHHGAGTASLIGTVFNFTADCPLHGGGDWLDAQDDVG